MISQEQTYHQQSEAAQQQGPFTQTDPLPFTRDPNEAQT
jgi:hypothetical protein